MLESEKSATFAADFYKLKEKNRNMAGYLSGDSRKVTTHRLIEMKQRGEKISMLTSYDYTIAQIVDGAGVDVILVGDSASNVMAGNVTTLPITIDQMIYHGKSVDARSKTCIGGRRYAFWLFIRQIRLMEFVMLSVL